MTKRRASDDVMGELHELTATLLLQRLQSGEATPAEINAAIKFLQNNGIEANLVPDSPLDKLKESLPSFDDDEDKVVYLNESRAGN
jgi:hypothetical protein